MAARKIFRFAALTMRLKSKEARAAIVQKLAADFNLPPIIAEAFYQQFSLYFQEHANAIFAPSTFRLRLLDGLRAFFKRPISFAFFLPIIGWIPILWRGYTRLINRSRSTWIRQTNILAPSSLEEGAKT